MTSVRRLYVLLVGYEVLPKSVSTKGLGDLFMMCEPICCYLLDTEHGWVLLDAGFDPKYARDPELCRHYFHDVGSYPPIVRAHEELPAQMAKLGVSFSDVRTVVLSHLHLDHAGYLKHFQHAPVYIQREEHEHGFSRARPQSYFLEDYNSPDIDWRLKEGDWELMPGVRFLRTRGHTPGHQSAVIELRESGTCVLPFDAGDLQENFDAEILPGECVDDVAARDSILRLKAIVQATGGRMLLFHDPVAIQHIRLAPDFYA